MGDGHIQKPGLRKRSKKDPKKILCIHKACLVPLITMLYNILY